MTNLLLMIKRHAERIAVIALICLYALSVTLLAVRPVMALTRKIPVYSVETAEKKVAITFDAAWGADKTETIMNILDEYSIKATFFLVGFWVEKYPELTAEIARRGFEIGTHSQTHPNLPKLSREKISEELTLSCDAIFRAAAVTPALFRPPFGDYDNKLITIAESLGLVTIQWDVDTLDWKGLSGQEIASRVDKFTRNGSIILCHNNSKHITEALPLIINILTAKGYTFTTVGDLLIDNGVVDHTGRQHPPQ